MCINKHIRLWTECCLQSFSGLGLQVMADARTVKTGPHAVFWLSSVMRFRVLIQLRHVNVNSGHMAGTEGLEVCSFAGRPAHNSWSNFVLFAHLKGYCSCSYGHGSVLFNCIPTLGWLTSWQPWNWLQMRPHRMRKWDAAYHNPVSLSTILASHFLE